MVIDKKTKFGGINITLEAIGAVAGSAATECYGVVGLAAKNSLRENIANLLKEDAYYKGVIPHKDKDDYSVDLYIIVAYGVKITEVVSEVQKKVKYVLEKTFDIKFKAVNVFVQGLKTI
ncbi:MAG TPA: Asp23/Gls24 family envelope stress response protein [Firmicutes bacterium]|jgi:uncharacterized alkaline shock family protein YloU|nr:Asp23/Gls24 family envelope stress response protein [Bacillota bacterium]HAV19669.1 Asp23/Gls24 family envelope stress response protein [Bacillota bacterium]